MEVRNFSGDLLDPTGPNGFDSDSGLPLVFLLGSADGTQASYSGAGLVTQFAVTGNSSSPDSSVSVPEPALAGWLFVVLLGFARRRKR